MKKFLLLISFIFANFAHIDSVYAGDCGIPDLRTNTRGSNWASISNDGNNIQDNSVFGLGLNVINTNGIWATSFLSSYVVYGAARCSNTSGTTYDADSPNDIEGKNCWCQATGYTSSSGEQGPDCTVSPVSSLWVFANEYEDTSNCMNQCAGFCSGRAAARTADFRIALYGAVPRVQTVDLTFDNVAAMSCTVGDTFVPPTPTPRPGYVFTGWKVRPKLDFTTIDTSTNGSERWSKGVSNNANICYYDTTTGNTTNVECNSDNNFSELQQYDWKVKFSHGSVYGVSSCATNGGTYAQPGTPTIANGSGTYCWCKATGYKANNATVSSVPESALSWVFNENNNTAANCAQYCAFSCTYHEEFSSSFRTALYTPASN